MSAMQDFTTCSQTDDKEAKREARSHSKRVAGQPWKDVRNDVCWVHPKL